MIALPAMPRNSAIFGQQAFVFAIKMLDKDQRKTIRRAQRARQALKRLGSDRRGAALCKRRGRVFRHALKLSSGTGFGADIGFAFPGGAA